VKVKNEKNDLADRDREKIQALDALKKCRNIYLFRNDGQISRDEE
jgi:hypothetical protein